MPEAVLQLIDWPKIDPFATRLVAAALFGIGIESFLGRTSTTKTFHALLSLKIIWSLFAIAGIGWTMIMEPAYRIIIAWAVLFTFILFLFVWSYWKLYLLRVLK